MTAARPVMGNGIGTAAEAPSGAACHNNPCSAKIWHLRTTAHRP